MGVWGFRGSLRVLFICSYSVCFLVVLFGGSGWVVMGEFCGVAVFWVCVCFWCLSWWWVVLVGWL